MGDYQTLAMDEVGAGEGPEYTCDWFTCGLCGLQVSSIEGYVSHMILQERCVLHLCPSTAVRDLLLPRFSKRRKRPEEEVKERGGGEAKVEVQAEEVELGDVRRWKCQVCGLTFSRPAAIVNHFKLQHSGVSGDLGDLGETHDPQVKEEEDRAPSPVKHIIAVDTQNAPALPQVEAEGGKAWGKLGCDRCGQIFKTGKILRAHIAVVHSAGRPFQCDFQGCGHTFKTKGSLKRHQRRHTGERPFACPECGRQFRESGSLARHRQAQVSCVAKTNAQIPLYGRTLPLHPPTHPDRKPTVPPDIKIGLKQELLSTEELPQSMPGPLEESKVVLRNQIVHGVTGGHSVKLETGAGGSCSAAPPPVCKMEPPPPPPPLPPAAPAPTSPSPPPGALDNIDANEPQEEDIKPRLVPEILRHSFSCPLCPKSYARRPALALHLKQHLDELGDRCSECQRQFTTRQALGRHLASHSSLRQYECGQCGKAFKLLSHAKSHLLSHTAVKSVACRYCTNVYKTTSARNIHERTHTGPPAFPCMECQRSFTTKASLIRHLRTHTGEAPFSCRHCGRTFKEHGTLSRHLRHKVPCAQQARMEKQLGRDVGIHLLPPAHPSNPPDPPIKDEWGVGVDDTLPSDIDQISEGDGSVFRELEEEEEEEEVQEMEEEEEEEDEDEEEEEEVAGSSSRSFRFLTSNFARENEVKILSGSSPPP